MFNFSGKTERVLEGRYIDSPRFQPREKMMEYLPGSPIGAVIAEAAAPMGRAKLIARPYPGLKALGYQYNVPPEQTIALDSMFGSIV